ncbi:RHS repeat protein, partial [bacterium]|nr:RHS repeat protein [bacterium]
LYASLKKEGDNYVLKDCVDWVYTFDSTGKVESVMDPQNHGWNYTYDGNGQLIEIRDNHPDVDKQRWIQLTYENGKLKSVRDDSTPARQVTYEYDGNGDLHYVTDVLGQKWEYTYDGTSHRLASVEVEVTTPSGTQKKLVERTEYDEQGRAWRQYNGNGELVVELNYETPGQTKARDGLGRETIYQFAPDRTLISVTDVLDSASEKTYDNNFRPAVLTDAYGNQIQNTWSADGAHLLNTVDALGGSITLQYEGNDLSSFEDALGHLTSYVYQDHLLRSVTDEQLKTTTFFEYTTQADYDLDRQPIGLLKKIIAPLNQVTEYHYDEFGRNDRVMQNGLVTTYTYDSLGRLINLTMPDGRTQATCYDLTGRVTRTVESSSPISSPCSEEFTPGEGDRVTENSYDAFGNLTAVVQPSGVVSRTYYDGANRPISTIQNWVGTDKIGGNPPQPEAAQPNQNVRTDLVYDATGNLIASIQVLPGCLVERVTDANGDPLRDANGTQIVTVTPDCIV